MHLRSWMTPHYWDLWAIWTVFLKVRVGSRQLIASFVLTGSVSLRVCKSWIFLLILGLTILHLGQLMVDRTMIDGSQNSEESQRNQTQSEIEYTCLSIAFKLLHFGSRQCTAIFSNATAFKLQNSSIDVGIFKPWSSNCEIWGPKYRIIFPSRCSGYSKLLYMLCSRAWTSWESSTS